MKRFAILGYAALLACALPAAAQQQDGAQTARNRIEVDLRSTSATGTLPFDVPFEMVGDVPDRVERISLIYRPCNGEDCPKSVARNRDCSPVLEGAWSAPSVWERDALTAARPGSEPRFALPIDPLDTQRRYVFLFDVEGTPTDDQVASFKPRVQDVVSRRFAAITSSDQPESFFTELRESVIAELRTAAPCIVVDEFLRTSTDVDEGFSDRVADVQEAQERKAQNVDAFNRGAENLREKLQAISASPLLTVVRKLRAQAASQPETAADLDAHADVIKLLSLGPAQLDVVARGASPSSPDRALASMTGDISADAATTRSNNLNDTSNLLRDLSAWVKRLSAEGALSADMSDDQRAALQRDVDAAANQAFAMKNLAANIARQTTQRDATVTAIADAVHQQIRTLRFIGADTIGTYDTFANWYISADAGFAYAQSAEVTVPYVGVNVYFRPINKDAPLRMKGGFKRRVSGTVALTVSSVADTKAKRQDLFNTQSLLIGGGMRVTDTLRVGLGVLVYEKLTGDPSAATTSELAASPYLSISFDWNVAKQFAGIGKMFQ